MPKPLIGEEDDKAISPDAAPASDAASSPAPEGSEDPKQDAETEVSVMDVMNKALSDPKEKDAEQPAEDAAEGEKTTETKSGQNEGEKAADAPKPEPTEISDEEMKSYPAKTQKRIRELLDQRRSEYEAHAQTKAELDQLKPMAERYQAIENFRVESDLSTDEMATGFEIMRLLKQDPVKALQSLRPYVTSLEQITGEALPADLQAEVDRGVISRERAQELSKARSAAMLQQQAYERANARAADLEKKQSTETQAREQRDAMNAWDAVQMQSDPDYKHIRHFMLPEIHALMAQQRPSNTVELTAILNRAKENVVTRLRSAGFARREQKPPVDPVRPVVGNSAPATSKAPENVRDIIDTVLAASSR